MSQLGKSPVAAVGEGVSLSVSQPAAAFEKAITARSVLIGLLVVMLWVTGICFMVVRTSVHGQYLLITLGFGALLTLFLLQFPRLLMVVLLAVWGGGMAWMLSLATRDDYGRILYGNLRALPVLLVVLGAALYLRRRPLKRGELVVIYGCLLIAIPWCIGLKACLESAVGNLFEVQRAGEPMLYNWAKQLPWWGPTMPVDTAGREYPVAAGMIAADLTLPAAFGPGAGPAAAMAPVKLAHEIGPQIGLPSAVRGSMFAAADAGSINAVTDFMQGNGGRVPWRLWWRPMLYWTGICLAFEAMVMGLLLMLRKRWIEHERLPFVWAEPPLAVIRQDQGALGGRRRWIPFVLGLAFCLPVILLPPNPSGEQRADWRCLPWAGTADGIRGGIDLTQLNLLPGVTFKLSWCPLVLVMFLLFPVDVLMTVALANIVLVLILPSLMTSMNLQAGPELLKEYMRWGLRLGGSLGLLFWSLWFARRTVWGYVKSLWGGKPTTAESQDEISRPAVMIIAAGGLAAFVLLGSYGNGATTDGGWSPVQMLLLTLLCLIFSMAQTRMRVEGPLFSNENNFGSHLLVSAQRDILHDHYTLAREGIPVTGSSWATHWMHWAFGGLFKSFGPHNMLLEAFKVGHEIRVHARTLALAILVTMLVVAAVTAPLYLTLMYTYGFGNSYQGGLYPSQSMTQWSERSAAYGIYSVSREFIQASPTFYGKYRAFFNVLYGVITVGVLFYLRREFPRFPLNPVGVVLVAEDFAGRGFNFAPASLWFSFLIAWLAKSLIFRWLGVRYFRKKVQPVVIMLLCGMVMGIMLYVFRQVSIGEGALK